jgi:hypothetical protein
VCRVDQLMTFQKLLWVPSSMVWSQSKNVQWIGMSPYIGVEWVWVESAVGSKGLGKVDMTATGSARGGLMQCSCGGNQRMS